MRSTNVSAAQTWGRLAALGNLPACSFDVCDVGRRLRRLLLKKATSASRMSLRQVPRTLPPKKSAYLSWAAGSLGWFYGLVFLGLSFTLVALFVMNLMMTFRSNIIPRSIS